ncbi:hypothetical protein ABPG74_007930 [Tetrahymena malaccensis]
MKSQNYILVLLITLTFTQIFNNYHQKKLIVIGQTGAGKSTLCNFLVGKPMFQAKESSESVTQKFQTEKISFQNFNLEITDTPGFTDPKFQDNWQLLNDITEYIKSQKIDFVIIVINHSLRTSNEEYILKWLQNTLPLNKQNSLILVNQHRTIQNFCQHEQESIQDLQVENCETNSQLDLQNNDFMSFIKMTFTNCQIESIGYNSDMRSTEKEFKLLAKKIKTSLLPYAILDHSNIMSLEEKIQIEINKQKQVCNQTIYDMQKHQIQQKLSQIDREIIEINNQIESSKQNIQFLYSQIEDTPDGYYTTGILWWLEIHFYFTRKQIQKNKSINLRIEDIKFEIAKKNFKLASLQEQIESYYIKLSNLSSSSAIENHQQYQDCLKQISQNTTDLINTKNYFQALNQQ